MAQLIVTAASGVAASIGQAGIGTLLARTVASTAASFAATTATRLLFGPKKRSVEGPRLEAFSLQTSTEGAPVLRVFGRARVSGELIWASRFKETTATSVERSGGKGGRLAAAKTTTTEYLYSVSFAVGLCEGPIARVGRVWADGKPLDLSRFNARVYPGTEEQAPDDLIAATQGSAPAFRGLAYVVFEDLPLAEFGNRIPQLSFEIEKPLAENDPRALENALAAVSIIPGSGEFVYGTTKIASSPSEGVTRAENAHTAPARPTSSPRSTRSPTRRRTSPPPRSSSPGSATTCAPASVACARASKPRRRRRRPTPGRRAALKGPARTSSAASTARQPSAARRPTAPSSKRSRR